MILWVYFGLFLLVDIDITNNNQENMQNNIQAKISFRKDMKVPKMNLPGIDKSLKGYGYKYQDFNDIVEEIDNVVKSTIWSLILNNIQYLNL